MRLRSAGIAAITLAASITASLLIAAPASADEEVTSDQLVSSSCVAQLQAAHKYLSASQMTDACTGDITSTVSPIHVLSTAEARQLAAANGLSEADTADLVARAGSGWIAYRDWNTSYKSWFVKETHEGRTYFDGENAWVTSYRFYAGKHLCHAEGSSHWFVHVETRECTQPDPSFEADSSYQFEVSAHAFGVNVDYVVGLHTIVDKAGDVRYRKVDHG